MARKKTQSKKEKVPYAILRPDEISDREVDRLSSSPDFVIERLRNSLDSLPEIDVTSATGARGALSNFFFKGPEKNLYNIITARSFNKMFSPEADQYAFEIPGYDRRDSNGVPLTHYQASMMRAADLASEIAEKRGESPENYRDTALEILKKNYSETR